MSIEEFAYALLDLVNENKELKRENLKLRKEKEASDKAFEDIATNNMNAISDTLEALVKGGNIQ